MKVQNFLMITLTLLMLACFSESVSLRKNKAKDADTTQNICCCNWKFPKNGNFVLRYSWWYKSDDTCNFGTNNCVDFQIDGTDDCKKKMTLSDSNEWTARQNSI